MSQVPKIVTAVSSHAIYLERVAAKFGNDVIPYLERIRRKMNTILNNAGNLSNIDVRREVIADINKVTREELQEYTTQYKLNNKELAVQDAKFNAKTLESIIPAYEAVIPSAAAINKIAIGTPVNVGGGLFNTYNKYVDTYWKTYADKIDSAVKTGFQAGQTNQQISSAILDQFDTVDKQARSAAKTMARTGTNHYSTSTTRAFVEANEDVIPRYRFIATLDNLTSRQCGSLDGQAFETDSDNIPFPPLHPNCRSRMGYDVDGRSSFDDNQSTRPSNFKVDDKRDPKRINSQSVYYDELGKLSAADQDAILGNNLGKAFRKMSPDDFAKQTINSTYEPLTIAEMKKKDNELGKILRKQEKT